MKESRIDETLLKILVCPESHQTLRLLEPAELQKINELILSGQASSVSGELIRGEWGSGLIRKDRSRAYQIERGLPILLADEAIALSN